MQRVGRIWLLIALLVLVPAPVAAERLTAGGDHDFAPYEFLDADGKPAGLNVDLIRAVGEVSGFDVDFILGPWAESRAAIATGQIDILPMYVADFRVRRDRTLRRRTSFILPRTMLHIAQNQECNPASHDRKLKPGKARVIRFSVTPGVQGTQLQGSLGLTRAVIEGPDPEREALRIAGFGKATRTGRSLASAKSFPAQFCPGEKLDQPEPPSPAPLRPVPGLGLRPFGPVTQGKYRIAMERIRERSGRASSPARSVQCQCYERLGWHDPDQDHGLVQSHAGLLDGPTPALIAGFLLWPLILASVTPAHGGRRDSKVDIEPPLSATDKP